MCLSAHILTPFAVRRTSSYVCTFRGPEGGGEGQECPRRARGAHRSIQAEEFRERRAEEGHAHAVPGVGAEGQGRRQAGAGSENERGKFFRERRVCLVVAAWKPYLANQGDEVF